MENITLNIHTKTLHIEKNSMFEIASKKIENLENWYLKKFDNNKILFDLNINADKKWTFKWNLILKIIWKWWLNITIKREDYKNLDDLIIHLFDHIKTELSK